MNVVTRKIVVRIISLSVWLFTLMVVFAAARADEGLPLKPGKPFDYSTFAFQPKSWEDRGLSLQLTPWTGKSVIFL